MMQFLERKAKAMDRQTAVTIASVAFGLVLLVWAGLTNYLLFHTAVEGFSVVVAALVCVLACTTHKYSGDDLLLFVGQAHMVIGVLDFLHLVAYQGMYVLVQSCANTATQLWIVGRYLWAAMFLMMPMFLKYRLPRKAVIAGFSGVAAVMVWAILLRPTFPTCFAQDAGLTRFKIVSEFVIIAAIVVGALLLRRRREQIDSTLFSVLNKAAIITIISEILFTRYSSVYGLTNMAGHIAKMVAYSLLLQGVVMKGLQAPYDSIFAKLQESAFRDPLTGLYNRSGFARAAQALMMRATKDQSVVGALMLDLDQFKRVNDTFGHKEGDAVLREFAHVLTSSVSPTDVVTRLGGDEFAVLLPDADAAGVRNVARNIRLRTCDWTRSCPTASVIDVSIGTAIWFPHMGASLDTLLHEADEAMYTEKDAKKQARSTQTS